MESEKTIITKIEPVNVAIMKKILEKEEHEKKNQEPPELTQEQKEYLDILWYAESNNEEE